MMIPPKIHALTAAEAVLALEGRHPTDDELKAYADIIMDGEHISNASTMRLITAVLDLRAALRLQCERKAFNLIAMACACEGPQSEEDYRVGYSFTCGYHQIPHEQQELPKRLARFLYFVAVREVSHPMPRAPHLPATHDDEHSPLEMPERSAAAPCAGPTFHAFDIDVYDCPCGHMYGAHEYTYADGRMRIAHCYDCDSGKPRRT